MGVLQNFSVGPSTMDSAFQPLQILELTLFAAVVVPLLWVLADYVRGLRLRQNLPPGPFPLPLFGNFFVIPKVKPWLDFEKWSIHYGDPMITIWQGHRPTIMCNDIWSISDLLDKRANIYSSRPHMVDQSSCSRLWRQVAPTSAAHGLSPQPTVELATYLILHSTQP